MKKEFSACPETVNKSRLYGFSWLEYVTAVPSPLVLVTGYKDNGKTNATMQSWLSFSSENGFYCIFASVNKYTHMYSCAKKTGQLVINFPSADIYKKCLATIENNGYDDDELLLSGLTAERSKNVNAPIVKECFLNLECEYVWEKELFPGSSHVVMCVKAVNVLMDDSLYSETDGRYGETGYLYNIHSPMDPESGDQGETALGIISQFKKYSEL